MIFPGGATALDLRACVATIHRDRAWPLKVLLYGGLALSVVGLPLAVGFVLESLDNSRKGYPTPLPPWGDWTLRWLTGILALLIDFVFFVMPLLACGLASLCLSVGLVVSGTAGADLVRFLQLLAAICGGYLLAMFLLGASPVGRLRFVREGRIEEALSFSLLRWAASPQIWPVLLRARLLSLPAYLPALLLAGLAYLLARAAFPGQLLALCIIAWLLLSALVYAHLVTMQLYVAAERALQRRALA
jgi:hypothetical protein